mgnify:CR=1 FL=1
MPIFNSKATLEQVHSYLAASGYFGGSQIGEPKAPPQGVKLFAAVYMMDASVTRVYVNGGLAENHVVQIRIYRNALLEPTKDIELELAIAVQQVASDLLGDYDLGATIREVDAGGMNGTPYKTEWGHVDLGGVVYRVADITLPLNIDDSATAAP